MQHQIVQPGMNAMLEIALSSGESVKAAAGSMVAKSEHIKVEGTMDGGPASAIKRSLLGGDKFFFESLSAIDGGGKVLLAPDIPAEIKLLDIESGGDFYLVGGSFLAAMGDIQLDTKMQRFAEGLVSGEGLFLLTASGIGTIAVYALGSIYQVDIPAGQEYAVDQGHVIAWPAQVEYRLEKAAETWLDTLTSGEGIVSCFSGPGTVYLQSRNPRSFARWIKRHAPSA
ncbi:MAG TPA: TIGR00266 family protein [Chroococcales cyanobacterium]